MTYSELKSSLGLKETALDRDFGMNGHKLDDLEREILPTYQPGTKDRPNRTRKPVVPLEDLSHMNFPSTARLQSQIRNTWQNMSEEQRAEASRIRKENSVALKGHKKIKH